MTDILEVLRPALGSCAVGGNVSIGACAVVSQSDW